MKVALLGIFLPSAGCAQEDSFDAMIGRLLRGDVPFAYPHELTDGVLILDAREPKEHEVSHIAGAVCVGYDDFELKSVDDVHRDTPIVVYCSVGYRSERIARTLIKAGFTDVRNLYGGVFHWKNQGHSVVNAHGATDSVHTYSKRWSKWLENGVKVHD